MSTRPLLAFVVMIAVLVASAVTGSAAASAATMPGHNMQMMEMGHCSSTPCSHGDGKSTPKQCCVAMCMAAVAIAPSAPAELTVVQPASPTSFVPVAYHGVLGEIATPPPRRA